MLCYEHGRQDVHSLVAPARGRLRSSQEPTEVGAPKGRLQLAYLLLGSPVLTGPWKAD